MGGDLRPMNHVTGEEHFSNKEENYFFHDIEILPKCCIKHTELRADYIEKQ